MKIFLVLVFSILCKGAKSAPAQSVGVAGSPISVPLRTQLGFTPVNMRQQKQLINIGEWIQNTPWLPIEINVPDFFGNIANGFASFGNYIQQLPLFQQWFSPQTPRPLKYYLIVPTKTRNYHHSAPPQDFIPFDAFTLYP